MAQLTTRILLGSSVMAARREVAASRLLHEQLINFPVAHQLIEAILKFIDRPEFDQIKPPQFTQHVSALKLPSTSLATL